MDALNSTIVMFVILEEGIKLEKYIYIYIYLIHWWVLIKLLTTLQNEAFALPFLTKRVIYNNCRSHLTGSSCKVSFLVSKHKFSLVFIKYYI